MRKELKDKLPELRSMAYDREKIKSDYMRTKGEKTVENLKKNNFDAYYTDSLKSAADLICDLIPDGAMIGCGDSHTLFALDMEDRLKDGKNCTVIPHLCAMNKTAYYSSDEGYKRLGSKEDMKEILKDYLTSDVFLLGANAVSLDGQIVNVDGNGNRVAGSMYGPDRIIVVAGVNKICKDVDAARDRIRFTAAPMNNLKYEMEDMPCVKAGFCVDCRDPRRICNMTTIIHKKPTDSDFHVVIIGEDLGF